MFLELDSEMTGSRKRTRKWAQKGAAVVVSCPDSCFLFRKRAREAASQGASGRGHSPEFVSWGTSFLYRFLEPYFSLKSALLGSNMVAIWLQN